MLHASNTSYTSFIPDPEEQRRQIAIGLAVRSDASGLPLLVDNFAGGGGASLGIEMAFGRKVDIAINHDGEALVMHSANHRETAHYQEDVFDVHPGFITGQRRIGLAWFSPDCKHHSKAKGGKPRDQKIRGLAWVALKWGALQKPDAIAIENVPELLTWGPLNEDGSPIKELAGRTFKAFMDALTTGLDPEHPDVPEIYETLGADFPMEKLYAGLGYVAEFRVLTAMDYGVPTIRTRLYIFARCDGQPIRWPSPTHGDPSARGFAQSGLKHWLTAADCIDFTLQGESIFERRRPLVRNTLRRVAKGTWRHVLTSAKPFIVGAGGPTYAGKPVPVDEPLGTVATENHRQVAQPSLAPFLTEHANASNQRTMAADEPLRTVCAQVKGGHFSMVAPLVVPLRGTTDSHLGGHAADAPISTVSAQGTHHALASAHLVTIGYGERQGQQPRIQDVEHPLGTVVAGGVKQAVTTAFMTKFNTGSVGFSLDEPTHTVMAGGSPKRPGSGVQMGMVAAHLVDMGHGETCASGVGRWGPGSRPVEQPLNTVVASGVSSSLAAIHLTHLTHHGDRAGRPADVPVATVTGAHRGEQALVAGFLEQANGGFYEGNGRPLGAPMSTVTASGTQQQLVTAYCVKYDGAADGAVRASAKAHGGPQVTVVEVPAPTLSELQQRRARLCAELLREHLPEHFDGPADLVLVHMEGQWWVLVDITLRMLTPRELARAQGFPDDYVIAPLIRRMVRRKGGRGGKKGRPANQDWVMVPLSKSAQVRMIGNSVCPPVAAALIRANFPQAEQLSQAA